MAPIFASADIAALVAAFPPPWPGENQPSLIRSLSGNGLYSSSKVLARFRTLLETTPNRIKVLDLPSLLGVERTEWLFKKPDDQFHYSRDRQSIITTPEQRLILKKLVARAETQIVEIAAFAKEVDIAPTSLDSLLDVLSRSANLRRFSGGGQDLAGSQNKIAEIQRSLRRAIEESGSDKVNLSKQNHGLPTFVLKTLITEVLGVTDFENQITAENDTIWYIPPGFDSIQEAKQKSEYEATVRVHADRLLRESYCVVETEDLPEIDQTSTKFSRLQQDVADSAQLRSSEDNLIQLQIQGRQSTTTMLIITDGLLKTTIDDVNDGVRVLVNTARNRNEILALENMDSADIPVQKSTPVLIDLVTRAEQRKYLIEALDAANKAAAQEEAETFAASYRESLMGSIELYVNGVETTTDAILRQHLEEYLCDYYRRELLHNFVSDAKARHLLLDKTRVRELEKTVQACEESKTLTSTQAAILKGARRLRISAPSSGDLRQIKQHTLQRNAKALRKMTRASDILQNLTWILLGCCTEGLYMSAGKDTSRMIKYYQALGDEATGRQLVEWRDSLKAGVENKEELSSMRALAQKAVDEIQADGVH